MERNNPNCKICGIQRLCDSHLKPGWSESRRIFNSKSGDGSLENPVHCRHYTCQIGEESARLEAERSRKDAGKGRKVPRKVLFESVQKPGKTRRVDTKTGEIESLQNGKWYRTGQKVDINN
jgi:hypothetical protein